MKIAFFTDTYEPQKNGVVTSINSFAEALRRGGHTVKIFSPGSPGYENKKVRLLKSVEFTKYPDYRIALPFLRPSEVKDFDVIHVHTPATLGMAGVVLAKYYDKPLVGTFHTLLPEYAYYFSTKHEKLTKRALWKYISIFYKRCDITIAPSNYMMYLLRKHDVDNLAVVPTGIRLKKMSRNKNALRRKYGFSKDDKIVLHVGRISREKNIQFIIHSIRKMLQKDVKLIITSDGPYRKHLEKLTRDNDNVIFTGFLDEKTLSDYYSISDVFVMASKSETQGIVMLEAAMHGLPMVVYDSPVVSEFVTTLDAGYVAKTDFPRKLRKMLSDSNARRKFRNNALKNVKKFNSVQCTNDLLHIYERVTNNRANTNR